MIEVKWADENRSSNFTFFNKYFNQVKKIQLVNELKREKTYPDNTEIRIAHHWLSKIMLP